MDDDKFSLFLEILKALESEDLGSSDIEKGIMNIIAMFKNDLTEEQKNALKDNITRYRARLKNKQIEEVYKDTRDWD